MVSRVSTERMRIRKMRINPLATRDLAQKHRSTVVLFKAGLFLVVHSAAFSARCKISACKVPDSNFDKSFSKISNFFFFNLLGIW